MDTQESKPFTMVQLPKDFDVKSYVLLYRIRFLSGKSKMINSLKELGFTDDQAITVQVIAEDLSNKKMAEYFKKFQPEKPQA